MYIASFDGVILFGYAFCMKKIIAILLLQLTVYSSISIGSYTKGSLQGASDLPKNDFGLQTMRMSQNKFWGHEEMIRFIKDLSQDSFVSNHGQLLYGDLSYRNGGYLPGHASHQIGLDVDVWFWRPSDDVSDLSDEIREGKRMPWMLDPRTNEFLPGKWDERLQEVLKLAAEDDRVARIFVNPGVKKLMCQLYPGQDFLKKIRPWWRHHEHFHVRLKCQAGSPKCVPQAPSTDIECDSPKLDWWFSEDFRRQYRRRYGGKESHEHNFCDAH